MIDLQREIHIGIIKTQKDYIRWANLGVGHGAEYLIVGNVARSVSKLQYTNDICNVFIEHDIQELANTDELQNEALRKGRCDICVEDDNEYSIIEVKNTLTSASKSDRKLKSIIQDIERIEIFLLNKKYFKECYVCFINANDIYNRKDTKKDRELIKNKIDNRLQEFKNTTKKQFKTINFETSDKFFIETTSDNELWGWQSVVVKIKLKDNNH